jgi:hypothetical protein
MNINNFLTKENLSTLWDVISDEDIFKFLSRDIQSKIAQLFSNNVKGFFETERTKTNSLVDINKRYIMLILNHIKKTYTQQIPSKITILDDIVLDVVKTDGDKIDHLVLEKNGKLGKNNKMRPEKM